MVISEDSLYNIHVHAYLHDFGWLDIEARPRIPIYKILFPVEGLVINMGTLWWNGPFFLPRIIFSIAKFDEAPSQIRPQILKPCA